MKERNGLLGRTTIGLALLMVLAACSSLPPGIPEAIGLASDRIELNATAAGAALDNLVVNAEVSRQQIAAAREQLDRMDDLSEESKGQMNSVLRLLDRASDGLQPSARIIAVKDETKPRLQSTSSALRQIQGILAEKVEQERVVENLVKRLRKAVSDEGS